MIRAIAHSDPIHDELFRIIEQIRRHTDVPGISLAVATPDYRASVACGIRAIGNSGALTPDLEFHIGCIAKLLLSLVVLGLALEDRLDPNAPLDEHLPELRGTVHGSSVALVHLLSHTSGYAGIDVLEPSSRRLTWEGLVAHLRRAPQRFAPGSVFSYEHTEAVLAAEIVERAIGQDVERLIRDRILEPLGISAGVLAGDQNAARLQVGQHALAPQGRPVRTGWSAYYDDRHLPFPDFWRPAYSFLTMSPAALAAIGAALVGASDDPLTETPAISGATRSQIQRSVVRVPGVLRAPGAEMPPRGFGFGAAEYSGGWRGIGAMSVGQCVALRFHPVHQASIAVGINLPAPAVRDALLETAAAFICGTARPPDPEPPPGLDLAELEGVYEGPGHRRCEVRRSGRRLSCCFSGRDSARTLDAEIGLDGRDIPTLRRAPPGLALGFFRVPGDEAEHALLASMAAYKRTPPV